MLDPYCLLLPSSLQHILSLFPPPPGWLDAIDLGLVDFSAFRVLRVLRPLRLIQYFAGIQAIIGSIWFGRDLIMNVLAFMFFYLLVFGILGVENFQGALQHRCVVLGPAPAGYIDLGMDGETHMTAYLAANSYTNWTEYADLAAAGDTGGIGEWDLWCSKPGDGGDECPSNMECITDFGNPHYGLVGFDNFMQAFILQFQVQTFSTWYEYAYMLEMSMGWYTKMYFWAIIVIVGFVVAQLFISVVCFGFESLAEELEAPVFSALIVDVVEDDDKLDEDADTLCHVCYGVDEHPLDEVLKDVDVGRATGIRVSVTIRVRKYPPRPLDIDGNYVKGGEVPCVVEKDAGSRDNGAGVGTPDSPLKLGMGSPNKAFNFPLADDMTGSVVDGGDTPQSPGADSEGVELEMQPTSPIPVASAEEAAGDVPPEPAEEPEGEGDAASSEQVGQGGGNGIDEITPLKEEVELTEFQKNQIVFREYQDFVERVQAAKAEREAAEAAKPPQTAADLVDKDELDEAFLDIEFVSDLKVWSNHNVVTLRQMLFEQEEIDTDMLMELYHEDEDSHKKFGISMDESLPFDVKVQELLPSWPVVDEDGHKDTINIPEITLQARFKVKVEVNLLTHPEVDTIVLHFNGNETVADLETQLLAELKENHPEITTSAVELRIDDAVLDHADSIWKVCVDNVEDFNPMTKACPVTVSVDSLENFISAKAFDNFIMGTIGLNTVFLAMEHYEAGEGYNIAQEIAEWVFNIIFFFEMISKIICLKGFSNYIAPHSNKFDFVIVMSSVIQTIITFALGPGGADQLSILKLFRLFRALRVARMLRKFNSVRLILDALMGALQPIVNIFAFMLLMLIVFACLGMQLYGQAMNPPHFEETPRQNFDDFLAAFYTLFQVLTGSAWEMVLFDCMHADRAEVQVTGFLFIMLFFLLSNYIILNLFIGAILANMGTDTDDDRLNETHKMKKKKTAAQLRARSAQIFANSKFTDWHRKGGKGDMTTMKEVMSLDFALESFEDSVCPRKRFGREVTNTTFFIFHPYHPARRIIYNLVKHPWWDSFILFIIIFSTVLLAMDNPTTREDPTMDNLFQTCDLVFQMIFTIEFLFKIFAYGFIWSDNIEFMLADQDCLKEIVLGGEDGCGALGEPAFMYSSWNYLDLIVLFVGFVNMMGIKQLKILRLLRAFRPLRMVNRIAGMKLVLMALAGALPALGNVCFLLVAVFLIFAILGLSLFSGKFYYCTDGESNRDNCHGTSESDDGYAVPNVWMNPTLDGWGTNSFDNIFSSFLVLFEVATGDSWESVLYLMTDVPDVIGEAPEEDNSRLSGMFCIVFVFVGQLFMLQLFVSVIIDSFNFAEGSGLLTGEQALFADMRKLSDMLNPEPKPTPAGPKGSIHWHAYNMFMNCDPLPVEGLEQYIESRHVPDNANMFKLEADTLKLAALKKDQQDPKYQGSKRALQMMAEQVQKLEDQIKITAADVEFCKKFSREALASQQPPEGWTYEMGKVFDHVITFCIVTNIGFMCATHYGEQNNKSYMFVKEFQNGMFLLVFIFEFVLKHIGLGVQQYWCSPFDAFDGIVVMVSIVFFFMDGGAIAGLFRIGRVFRLIKRAPALQALMTSMIMTVPAISNVFAVMGLLFFMFAVCGVELFSGVRYGFAINQVDNYKTWGMSMSALWRGTLGNWRSNMYDTMVQPPFCTSDYEQYVWPNHNGQNTVEVDDCGVPIISNTTVITDAAYSFMVNDCGSAAASIFYHCVFQIMSTFAVLNVVIAIILGAFTWCYSLEEGELTSGLPVTADHLRHFKAIWNRFDLYSTGEIGADKLQLFFAVLRYNIPEMFCTGVRTQSDQMLYKDYSSFGSGGIDPITGELVDSKEAEKGRREKVCRRNYEELIGKIGDFERSAELWRQLEDAGCDVWMGCNDNVAGFDIKRHPLGSMDANLHIFTKEVNNGIIFVPQYSPEGWHGGNPADTQVQGVSFLSLINILVSRGQMAC